MTATKRFIRIVTVIVMAFVLIVVCMPFEAEAGAAKINKKKITLMTGSEYKLTVKGLSAKQRKKIKWSSTKPGVASVGKYGTVKARNRGETKIIAKYRKKKFYCTVKVKPAGNFKWTKEVNIMENGGTYVIKVRNRKEAGEYEIRSWNDSKNALEADVIFKGCSIVKLKERDVVKLYNCYMMSLMNAPVDVNKQGMFKVGTHITKGSYKVVSNKGKEGYIEIYDSIRIGDKPVKSFILSEKGSKKVTLKNGQYIRMLDCHIGKKL